MQPVASPLVAPTGRRSPLRESLAAFSHRNFRLFWFGGLVSNSGRWLTIITMPAVLYQLTESATWVGAAGFATLLPAVFVGPIGGSLGDRMSRRRLLLYTQAFSGVVSLGQAVAWFAGVREPWAYLGFAALTGVMSGLNLPVWQAFVTELVPRGLLHNAVTLNSAQFTSARAFGPALGGVVLATAGPGWAFTLDAVSFLAVMAALSRIALPDVVQPQPDGRPRPWREAWAALQYVRARRGVVWAIAVTGVVGLFGSAIVRVLVVLAEEALGVGEGWYGALIAAYGIGSIFILPLLIGRWKDVRPSTIVPVGMVLYAAAVVTLGAAPGVAIAAVALMGMGAGHLSISSTLNSSIQLQVDEHTRSKVIALYLMVVMGAQPAGALVMGALADGVGIRPTVVVSGIITALIGVWLRSRRDLRSLDGGEPPETQ